jgi:hypothetical protein
MTHIKTYRDHLLEHPMMGPEAALMQEVKELRTALTEALGYSYVSLINEGNKAQPSELVRQVSWNLEYTDSTPKLNVMHSAFEDWYQQQPFATGPNKQLCRDSYAAGMGDPLVTYATSQAAQPVREALAQPVQAPLTVEQIEELYAVHVPIVTFEGVYAYARAIEHAHGIKEAP